MFLYSHQALCSFTHYICDHGETLKVLHQSKLGFLVPPSDVCADWWRYEPVFTFISECLDFLCAPFKSDKHEL